MQDVWGDRDKHGFHVNISQKISKLFKELWDDKNVPKEYKIEIKDPVWRAYGGERTEYGQIIRLPWFNVAILDGSIISLNQLDDILEATGIANEEIAKMVEEIERENKKNPSTNDKPYGEILTYYKDASLKLVVYDPDNRFGYEKNIPEKDCKK